MPLPTLIAATTPLPPTYTLTPQPPAWTLTPHPQDGAHPMNRLSALTTEYLRYRVDAVRGGAPIDPTTGAVAFAFLPATQARPTPGDWVTGSWETTTTYTAPQYVARALIGPSGGTVLAPGTWTVWVRVTDTTEAPIRDVGQITIF